MKKFRVYFATKVQVSRSWFRRKKDVSETDYVVVSAHNEAHAHKEAKKYIDINALGLPFEVTHIAPAADDEAEGRPGSPSMSHLVAEDTPEETGPSESDTNR